MNFEVYARIPIYDGVRTAYTHLSHQEFAYLSCDSDEIECFFFIPSVSFQALFAYIPFFI